VTTETVNISPPEQVFRFLADRPEYGSAEKHKNYYRLAAARKRGALKVNASPVYIRFETHARCNLRCCWAHRSPNHPGLRPRGPAGLDLARRVLDQVGDDLYQVILAHWGEPTLNRQLPEFVRLFHETGIYTAFDTNMTLMTPRLAAALVDAGLDYVSASIDGVSQQVYAQYRRNGDAAKAIAGLRYLADYKQRVGRSTPFIRWQYLVFEHNEHEIELARTLARDIGLNSFDVFGGSGRPWSADAGFTNPPADPERPAGLLCQDPWTYLAIDWDGAVHLCCKAFAARDVMGHMDDHDLRTIFDNERFQLARRVIRGGTWSESDGRIPCTGCNRVKQFAPSIGRLNHVLTID
jgi:MoaA/NifB/PqqE/SkfB family radical SAM enzyme